LLFIPAYFYLIKYGEGWTNRSIAGSITDGQPHQELVTQSYTVERVIYGDTLKLTNGERVRLIGIDTPESRINDKAKRDSERTGQDLETITKMGQEATEFMKGLIKPGEEIRLEFDVQKKDKYGRLLSYAYRFKCSKCQVKRRKGYYNERLDDGLYLFINASIIESGYATPMTIPPNVKYADLFQELYEDARENKRGLWKNGIAVDQVINLELLQDIPNVIFLQDDVIGGGAPSQTALEEVKKQGFKAVIDLRTEQEGTKFEEVSVEKLGMKYFNIPIYGLDVSEEKVNKLAQILSDLEHRPALLHCALGGRVHALWERYQRKGQ